MRRHRLEVVETLAKAFKRSRSRMSRMTGRARPAPTSSPECAIEFSFAIAAPQQPLTEPSRQRDPAFASSPLHAENGPRHEMPNEIYDAASGLSPPIDIDQCNGRRQAARAGGKARRKGYVCLEKPGIANSPHGAELWVKATGMTRCRGRRNASSVSDTVPSRAMICLDRWEFDYSADH